MFPFLNLPWPPVIALLFIVLLCICDREVGDGEKGWLKRSAAMGVAIFGCGLLGYLTFGPWFSILGVLWAAWRSLGFFHGSGAPQTGSERLYALLRQVMFLPVTMLAYWQGGDWRAFGLFLLAAALLNTAIRWRYGYMVIDAKAHPAFDDEVRVLAFNALQERLSGVIVGAAIAGYAFWNHAGLRLFAS